MAMFDDMEKDVFELEEEKETKKKKKKSKSKSLFFKINGPSTTTST